MDDADGRVVDAAAWFCCFVAFDNDSNGVNLLERPGSLFFPCRGAMMQGMVEYKENDGAGKRLSIKGCSRLWFIVGKVDIDCLASDVHLFMNLRFLDGVDEELI